MGNFGRKIWSKCIVQMVQQRKCNKCPELRSLRDSNALQAKSFVIISRVSFLQELQSHLSEQAQEAWKMNNRPYSMLMTIMTRQHGTACYVFDYFATKSSLNKNIFPKKKIDFQLIIAFLQLDSGGR